MCGNIWLAPGFKYLLINVTGLFTFAGNCTRREHQLLRAKDMAIVGDHNRENGDAGLDG